MIHRRTGRGRIVLLVFLALSIAVITLDFQRDHAILDVIRDASRTIVEPVERGFTAITRPIGNFFSSLADLSSLREDNAALRNENKKLEAEMKRSQAIEEENEKLTGLLDLDPHWAAGETVTAEVVGVAPSNYKWAIHIDKGSNDGIGTDMAVVDLTAGLVGKVVEVSDNSATVILLIDPQAAAGALVKGQGDSGRVRGNGDDEFLSLEFISTKTKVDVGDDVVTSGYNEGIFPRGIPIGKVVKAGFDSGALEQDILISPFANFQSLDFVEVLLESGRVETPTPKVEESP